LLSGPRYEPLRARGVHLAVDEVDISFAPRAQERTQATAAEDTETESTNKTKSPCCLMDTVWDWKRIHRTEDDMTHILESSKFGCPCSEILHDDQGVQLLACCEK
jgi:hypothetical protein